MLTFFGIVLCVITAPWLPRTVCGVVLCVAVGGWWLLILIPLTIAGFCMDGIQACREGCEEQCHVPKRRKKDEEMSCVR